MARGTLVNLADQLAKTLDDKVTAISDAAFKMTLETRYTPEQQRLQKLFAPGVLSLDLVSVRLSTLGLTLGEALEMPFEDLPGDWHCPVCGVGKDQFEEA